MSAPGIGRNRITLPDFDRVGERFEQIGRLPKPVKAFVYLIITALGTVVGLAALAGATLLIGVLTNSFSLTPLLGG